MRSSGGPGALTSRCLASGYLGDLCVLVLRPRSTAIHLHRRCCGHRLAGGGKLLIVLVGPLIIVGFPLGIGQLSGIVLEDGKFGL